MLNLTFNLHHTGRTFFFKKNYFGIMVFFWAVLFAQHTLLAQNSVYHLIDYGVKPNTGKSSCRAFAEALAKIKAQKSRGNAQTITFAPGRYDFFPEDAIVKEYYVSNHDQTNPKSIGLLIKDFSKLNIEGNGAEFIFHGRMLPIVLEDVQDLTVKNIQVDFETPQICQVEILKNDTLTGTITYQTAPWVKYEIRKGIFFHKGEGWEISPSSGIAFEKTTKHLVFNSGDIRIGTKEVTELRPGIIEAKNWRNKKLIPGTVVAMRSWERPNPGIFVYHAKNLVLKNVNVHYSEGMGLLVQVSENIKLDQFKVSLRGKDDPRYFTTQADATHFSGCKGKITSINGLYEGMMDDAINIHGTYLKIIKRKNDFTFVAKYMHGQSFGFEWGRVGDKVKFIAAETMENIGHENTIVEIKAVDKPSYNGAKEFEIKLKKPVDKAINEAAAFGIENMTWTPEVLFANNTIRNNRARGALFSTPRRTIIENNLFDHTSGSAIVLCGDSNGWFETGACTSVMIRNNRFINSLTSLFQFTNAIISIYPEIPNLKKQTKYFHSGITIKDNYFETFDHPILYAKSVDGLSFTGNTIKHNQDYPAFHPNKNPFYLQKVRKFHISGNHYDVKFDNTKDIKVND
ncbi:right-handed parallel beta-helix repeat-containing protein [Pedobacter sp. ASV28]|uniref:right-handed parallel beta-helix repeat-containing protein n=1 Tax=Pedobacter sp. ASV28 TaxID=2795123 RepID=UPI001E5D3202|nr:right-handed parallel beta-helix repeat-containing protein [Pedobacter sp. ASV28]